MFTTLQIKTNATAKKIASFINTLIIDGVIPEDTKFDISNRKGETTAAIKKIPCVDSVELIRHIESKVPFAYKEISVVKTKC